MTKKLTEAEKDRMADLSAGGDPRQRAITRAALNEVGGKVLVIEHRPGEFDGKPWLVVDKNSREVLMFGGIAPYGGADREEAIEDAERIASKWDWAVEAG
jgi:hypothetical protein